MLAANFEVGFSDRLATGLLMAVCILGAALQMAPRLLVERTALSVVQPPLTVSVQGEVVAPGNYTLPFGSRVDDAVAAAGGLTPAAAPELVASAAPLTDGQALVVPALMVSSTGRQRISLNSASSAELDSLPGVGPVIAERIVHNRPYAAIEDLLKVPGIGPRTVERLTALVAP